MSPGTRKRIHAYDWLLLLFFILPGLVVLAAFESAFTLIVEIAKGVGWAFKCLGAHRDECR
ncbi:MAG: hypothetical protein HY749_17860 [Gammaproteobacteria bacterium]|nr:hypothetical protein [Gammaproteobacteria bacterium]MBI5618168.1 hypothetical protein [Gammaproteobacteria bacterium]